MVNDVQELLNELQRTATPLRGACAGIYFLFDGEEVVYVGQSWNCQLRVGEHTRRDSQKKFLKWNFMPVDAAQDRTSLERSLIDELKPRFNLR